MKIEVLGPGCPNCAALARNVKATADKLSLQYELTKITDITEIMKYGVMMTPALVIDGEVKSSGKVRTEEELTKILTEAGSKEPGA